MQEMPVRSLGWKDPLEEEMATHPSILAWKTMNRGAMQAIVHGVTKKSRKRLSNHAHITINYNKSCVNVVSLSNCINLMPFPP